MQTWLAFLRAINLGAKRTFPKAEIAAATQTIGAVDVATHINTGNVRLLLPDELGLSTRADVEAALEASYLDRIGFEVPTIAFTPQEFAQIAADATDLHHDGLERHYIYLTKSQPDPELSDALHKKSDGEVVVRPSSRAVHVLLGPGYQAGSVDVHRVEKSLGVVATNRNYSVVSALNQKWAAE